VPGRALRTVTTYYRVDRKEISYLKFIVEAYDGIAVVTTIDPVEGVIALRVAPGCEGTAERLIKDLGKELMIERVEKTE